MKKRKKDECLFLFLMCVMMSSIGISQVCVTVQHTAGSADGQVSWQVQNSANASDIKCQKTADGDTPTTCCAPEDGSYTVACVDSAGNGWDGYQLYLSGVEVCGNFTSGASKSDTFAFEVLCTSDVMPCQQNSTVIGFDPNCECECQPLTHGKFCENTDAASTPEPILCTLDVMPCQQNSTVIGFDPNCACECIKYSLIFIQPLTHGDFCENIYKADFSISIALKGNCDVGKCFVCEPCLDSENTMECPTWCEQECNGCAVTQKTPIWCDDVEVSGVDQYYWMEALNISNCMLHEFMNFETGEIGSHEVYRDVFNAHLCLCELDLPTQETLRCNSEINEIYYLKSRCGKLVDAHWIDEHLETQTGITNYIQNPIYLQNAQLFMFLTVSLNVLFRFC